MSVLRNMLLLVLLSGWWLASIDAGEVLSPQT